MKLQDFISQNKSKMNEIEQTFVEDIFYPYAGENGLDFLQAQTPFDDSQCRTRKLDFTISTNRYRYVIEIDGYTYHAEGALRVTPEYFDDLLMKHNDLILNGYILIRFSYNQIRNHPDVCINTLRRSFKADAEINPYYQHSSDIQPTIPQQRSLDACEYYRGVGLNKGVVILPTGMGKTIFAALDAKRLNCRTLFIVHKNEILREAYEKFSFVWPDSSKGFYNANEKDTHSQIIFASKDTLYRDGNLEQFKPDDFDLIIIDEVHHSSCTTYRKIIDYFTPKYMLGMTATPERQDRADILELFSYNVYYELSQKEAIEGGYLSGFRYYGLTDDIDYSKIKHNGIKYDVADLGRKLNIPERNEAILRKYQEIVPNTKAIGFCVDINHAISVAAFFTSHGIPAKAVHSDTKRLSEVEKKSIIQDFRDGVLQIVFTIDLFNEGVDFPDVETLLFLRPTESKTIFIQQLGRGLRLNPNKTHVTVLDFIGNFKKAANIRDYIKGAAFGGTDEGTGHTSFGVKDFLDWPLGCDVHFDSSVEEIFKAADAAEHVITQDELIDNYYAVKEKIERKPVAEDMNNETISAIKLRHYQNTYKTWNKFLEAIGEATMASYHYPQGTHLGHIFYLINTLGEGQFTDLISPELYISENGLTKLARQTRYKVWACMEIGFLYDDRNPDKAADGITFTHLTPKGKALFDILKKYVTDPSFYNFREGGKTEVSWQMAHNESYVNEFVRTLPIDDRNKLEKSFLIMDAVKQMLIYLFRENKNKCEFVKSEVYSNYFNAPYIQHYFEMNGISLPTVEGAKHRLPFILSILDAFGIIEFTGASKFRIIRFPLTRVLFEETKAEIEPSDLLAATSKYFSDRTQPDPSTSIVLKQLFGTDFLSDRYSIKP